MPEIKESSDIEYLKKYIREKNLDDAYYQNALSELKKGRPIQYIIGEVYFYGYNFKVNENVLIPRYETELLVDLTINKIKEYFSNKKIDILDLGTGSGCIAITLKKELNGNVDAVDISKEALDVAHDNALLNDVNINFINDDMTTYKNKKYDVIIANPPYISYDEKVMDLVYDNEPHLALYATNNGLYFYDKIINNLKYLIKNDFLVAFEIGCNQANDIVLMIKNKLDNVNILVDKDYSNRDRYIFITNMEK